MYLQTRRKRLLVFTVCSVACVITAYFLVFQKKYAWNKNINHDLISAAARGDIWSQHNLAGFYYRDQNYSEAYKWFKRAANSDFPMSQHSLGLMYLNGLGVKKDYSKAVKWVEKAVESNYSSAQFTYGQMYMEGQGVPQSDMDAARWIRMAAEQGLIKAEATLGAMYFKGQGVPKNYVEAEKWIRLAAEQNHAEAQFYLAEFYYNGYVEPRDLVLAYMWANLSATRYKKADGLRNILALIMAPEQISEAQSLSSEINYIVGNRHKVSSRLTQPDVAYFADSAKIRAGHFYADIVKIEENDEDIPQQFRNIDNLQWPVFQVDLDRDDTREFILVRGDFQQEYTVEILKADLTRIAYLLIEHEDTFRSIDFLDLNNNKNYELLIRFISSGSSGFIFSYIITAIKGEYVLYDCGNILDVEILGDLNNNGSVELSGGEKFRSAHYGNRNCWIVVPKLWNWTGAELIEVSDRFPRFYSAYGTLLEQEILQDPRSEKSKNARIIYNEIIEYLGKQR